MKKLLVFAFGVSLLVTNILQAELQGLWEFVPASDPNLMLTATIGNDLELSTGGTHTSVAGFDQTDGAVQIGVGSYFICDHDIAPNGGSTGYVNEYSLLLDIMYPLSSAGKWICLFQTNSNNTNDGDCFIRSSGGGVTGSVGVAATGYSTQATQAGRWYRVIVSVDNGSFYRIYVNGELWLEGVIQNINGRFALDPTILFFADEDGEDNDICVSTLAIWDEPLDETMVSTLGEAGTPVGEVVGSTSAASVTLFEKSTTPQTFNLQLTGDAAPTAPVIVTVDPNTILGNEGDFQLIAPGQTQPAQPGEPITVTFTPENWQTPQIIGVVPVDDTELEGIEEAGVRFVASSADSHFDGGIVPFVKVVIYDDESSGFFVAPVAIDAIENGPAATYSVVLTGVPSSSVTISIQESSTPNRVTVDPATLIFSPANAAIPQIVSVTVPDDTVYQGKTYTTALVHQAASTDENYALLPEINLPVTIFDNDCGAWGFLPADLNHDCRIDLDDIALLAGSWLHCTQPFVAGCDEVSLTE